MNMSVPSDWTADTATTTPTALNKLDIKFPFLANHPGGEDSFESLQFHFHAPSEHTVDGVQYDLEMHIVH